MKKKICKDWKGYDKIFHLALIFALGCVLSGAFSFIPWGAWTSAIAVFVICVIVGIWKEAIDAKKEGGHFCIWDLLADIIAALAVSPIAYFANYFTNIE